LCPFASRRDIQKDADSSSGQEHTCPARADEGQGQTFGRQHYRDDADIQGGLNADGEDYACREQLAKRVFAAVYDHNSQHDKNDE
jgi:hypothetical protein